MKTFRFFMLISGIMAFNITVLNAQTQSRKEIIESLTEKVNSLTRLLKDKDESLKKVEIQLAKMEGAAEANQFFFKQYENKTDSLSKSISNKDSLINNLNNQLTKLKASFFELEENKKEISSKNEILQAELNTYKQNNAPAQPVKKEATVEPANTVAKEKIKEQPVKTAAPE